MLFMYSTLKMIPKHAGSSPISRLSIFFHTPLFPNHVLSLQISSLFSPMRDTIQQHQRQGGTGRKLRLWRYAEAARLRQRAYGSGWDLQSPLAVFAIKSAVLARGGGLTTFSIDRGAFILACHLGLARQWRLGPVVARSTMCGGCASWI